VAQRRVVRVRMRPERPNHVKLIKPMSKSGYYNSTEHLASDLPHFVGGQHLVIRATVRLGNTVSADYRATSRKENQHEQSRSHVRT
jgi:hypothetical protein